MRAFIQPAMLIGQMTKLIYLLLLKAAALMWAAELVCPHDSIAVFLITHF